MRILAFVDTHEDPDAFDRFRRIVKKENVDLICCMGDFTIFGRQTEEMLHELNTLGAPVLLIHGNHEDEEEVLSVLDEFPNISWVHDTFVDVQGFRFVGFGGHGFHQREEDLEQLEQRLADKFTEKTIIMSHAPPYETNLDEVEEDWHVGNESLTELIERRKPLLVLCGHIHQCFHEHDVVLTTKCINPGPDGEIIDVN